MTNVLNQDLGPKLFEKVTSRRQMSPLARKKENKINAFIIEAFILKTANTCFVWMDLEGGGGGSGGS